VWRWSLPEANSSLQINSGRWGCAMYDAKKNRQLRHVVVRGSHIGGWRGISFPDSGWAELDNQ
jgi:hypothetical protein